MKVLLVEDSLTLRYTMTAFIESAGHQVICAEDGETALQLVEAQPVDIIFMDVQMPGLDGFETTRLIREGLGDYWVPIVFVTGEESENSYNKGIEAGGDDYLIKPVSEVVLKAKIRAMERIVDMRNQLSKLNKELLIVSQRDSLTHLYNRRTFDDKALDQWRIATRNRDPLSLLLFDIDHFKLYNDTYGHPAGDECISKVVEVLKACMSRPSDILARFGGEEFIALLPGTPEQGALHIADEIRRTLHELNIRHRASPTSDRITLSIGGSIIHYTTGTDLTEQIKYADQALYQSKNKGRNCSSIRVFRPHRKVFVVYNNADELEMIDQSLDGHCFLSSCHYGDNCLEKIKDFNPDLVLLDVDSPNGDGASFCETLKQQPDLKAKPTVLMSLLDKKRLVEIAKKSGANAVLDKPLDSHLLVARVNEFLV